MCRRFVRPFAMTSQRVALATNSARSIEDGPPSFPPASPSPGEAVRPRCRRRRTRQRAADLELLSRGDPLGYLGQRHNGEREAGRPEDEAAEERQGRRCLPSASGLKSGIGARPPSQPARQVWPPRRRRSSESRIVLLPTRSRTALILFLSRGVGPPARGASVFSASDSKGGQRFGVFPDCGWCR